MSHGGGHAAEHAGSHESKGGKGITRREFLEMSPFFLFGSLLMGVSNTEGVSKFLDKAGDFLTNFFGGPFSGGGGGGGGGHHEAHGQDH